MGKEHLKIRIYDIFLRFYLFWYATEIIANSTIMKIEYLPIKSIHFFFGCLILSFMVIQALCFQKYTLGEGIVVLIISIVIIISTVTSKDTRLLFSWLFVFTSKNTEIDVVIKKTYKILVIMTMIVIGLNIIGFLPDYTIYKWDKIRYSLGFAHPNQLGLRIGQIVICHFYLNKDNLRLRDYILAILLAIFTYIVPNSQTAFIIIVLVSLLSYVYLLLRRIASDLIKIYSYFLVSISTIVNILSIYLSTRPINNHIIESVNSILSYRFSMCYKVYSIYGITWFGNDIAVSLLEREAKGLLSLGSLWLDNAYMSMLVRYGIVTYLIISVLYILSMIYMVKIKEYYILTLLFIYSVYGVMENYYFQISGNIMLFTIGYLIYKRKLKQ